MAIRIRLADIPMTCNKCNNLAMIIFKYGRKQEFGYCKKHIDGQVEKYI